MAKKLRKKPKSPPKFKGITFDDPSIEDVEKFKAIREERFKALKKHAKHVMSNTFVVPDVEASMSVTDQATDRMIRATLKAKAEPVMVELVDILEPSHTYNKGDRVTLTGAEYRASPSNPCVGSDYECEGTIHTISNRSSYCLVYWDNGTSNNYTANRDLKIANKALIDCKSIW